MFRRGFLKAIISAIGGFFGRKVLNVEESALRFLGNVLGPARVVHPQSPASFSPFEISRERGMRFLVFGDWGTGELSQSTVALSMSRTAKSFGCNAMLTTGDNFYPLGISSTEDEQWETKFTDVYAAAGLTQPFWAILGNHDHYGSPDAQVKYSAVNPQWKMPSAYYTERFEAADGTSLQIFVLDTTPIRNRPGYKEEQQQWLDKALQASTAQWKIVMGHHPMYGNSQYGDQQWMRDAFEELLIARKATMYLCGHNHCIEFLNPVQGVYHLTSGAGGKEYSVRWTDHTYYAATNCGYVWLAATHEALYFHFHDADGNIRYAHSVSA